MKTHTVLVTSRAHRAVRAITLAVIATVMVTALAVGIMTTAMGALGLLRLVLA